MANTHTTSRPILLVLGAAVLSWSLFMVALYTDLFVEEIFEDGQWVGQDPPVRPSTYLFFAAIAVFALAALSGQRMAIRDRVQQGSSHRPSRGAHRFTTLGIIMGLAIAAVLGVSTFLTGFNEFRAEEEDLGIRTLTTYLPIILYTTLVVAVILFGFVFRSDTLPKTHDRVPEGAVDDSETPVHGSQRDLGAAYAIPIVATAIALIFGLVVYDVTGTSLQVWVWVIIQAVIGSGIVVGTIFGERAVAQGPTSQSSRSRVTRSARGLNFVLSIVFGAIVTGMAFGYGGSAIDSLRISPYFALEILAGPGAPVESVTVGATAWDVQEGSTVSISLEQPAQTLLASTVEDPDYFYETRPLPGNLEAGEYVLTAQATSVDGRLLSRELEFSISDDGEVFWDPDKMNFYQYEQDEETITGASGKWFIEDFLPAVVLLFLALGAVYLTLTERNRPARGIEPSV